MTPIDKDLEKQIIDLKSEIDKLSLDFGDDLSPELRDLRHRVFSAHTEIEIGLEIRIILSLFDTTESKDRSTLGKFLVKASDPIGALSFSRKLYTVKKLLSLENNNLGLAEIQNLNNIRNEFAHPKTKSYAKYNSREQYKKALETICAAIKAEKDLPVG